MKTRNYLTSLIILFAIAIFSGMSCKKTADENPDTGNSGGSNGLQVKDIDNKTLQLPVDSGDVGIIIDTRNLFKKGYNPSYASVQISGSLSSYSNDTLHIDQFTNLAIISIPKNKLTSDEQEQAAIGPKVVITTYDEQGKMLTTVTESSLPINDLNNYYVINSNKDPVPRKMSLNPEIPYLIQSSISSTEKPEVLTFLGEESNPIVREAYKTSSINQEFYFIPANESNSKDDSTYYIRTSLKGGNSKYYYLDMYSGYDQTYKLYAFNDEPASNSHYKFILRRDDSGWVYIKPADFSLLEDDSPFFAPNDGSHPARFKIICANIDWEITDLGSKLNQPIMPSQKLELAVSNQLINCSSGTLSQTLGKEDSKTQTTSVSTSEEFQLTSSEEKKISVTTTVGAEGSFFGVGASASIGVTGEYTYGTTVTNTTGKTLATSTEETKTISTVRTIEVPPYSGVNVYDAVESYPDVQIPFVQRFRVAGSYNGVKLKGNEIVDQLMKDQFGGVVSQIGEDFILISIRGTATIDNYLKVQSKASEVPDACSAP